MSLTEHLVSADSDEKVHEALKAALKEFDELNTQKIAETGACLDCRAGCALCCQSLRVDAYAHEVFLIADYVQRHFSQSQLEELLARLEKHAGLVLPLTPLEHATSNFPCPLLEQGCCSVYAVRPQACRRHHSLDVGACQYTFDHPLDLTTPAAHHPELFSVLTHAMQATTEAYAALKLDTTIYELGTALHEALTEPESWEAWKNHMEAFVKASITPRA